MSLFCCMDKTATHVSYLHIVVALVVCNTAKSLALYNNIVFVVVNYISEYNTIKHAIMGYKMGYATGYKSNKKPLQNGTAFSMIIYDYITILTLFISSCMVSFITCAYKFIVMSMELCPKIFCRVLGFIPDSIQRVANVSLSA